MDKGPRVVAGGSIQQLMDMLGGGRDEEHDAIVDTVSKHCHDRLKEISGDNVYSQEYIHDMWHEIMGFLQKKELTHKPGLTAILQVVIEGVDMKHKLSNELKEKRKLRRESDKQENVHRMSKDTN